MGNAYRRSKDRKGPSFPLAISASQAQPAHLRARRLIFQIQEFLQHPEVRDHADLAGRDIRYSELKDLPQLREIYSTGVVSIGSSACAFTELTVFRI